MKVGLGVGKRYEPISRTPPPWETTPLWHWRRWFGYSMRRRLHFEWGSPSFDGERSYAWNAAMGWAYATPRDVAREVLAQQFDRDHDCFERVVSND